jgi:hypothetical protein
MDLGIVDQTIAKWGSDRNSASAITSSNPQEGGQTKSVPTSNCTHESMQL